MDLGVGEMGLTFCGKHPLLMTRTQVSNPGPMGPLVYLIFSLVVNQDMHKSLDECEFQPDNTELAALEYLKNRIS